MVSVVPRGRAAVLVMLVLAGFTLASAATPAWAHLKTAPEIIRGASDVGPLPLGEAAPTDQRSSLPGSALVAAPAAPGLAWPAVVGALGIAMLAWRRTRRVVALTLVLFLTLFAFEDGLHAVHHGLDKSRMTGCPLAAAAAHLSATAVDRVVSADMILPVVAPAPESAQPDAGNRRLCPDQGRAPPPAIV